MHRTPSPDYTANIVERPGSGLRGGGFMGRSERASSKTEAEEGRGGAYACECVPLQSELSILSAIGVPSSSFHRSIVPSHHRWSMVDGEQQQRQPVSMVVDGKPTRIRTGGQGHAVSEPIGGKDVG